MDRHLIKTVLICFSLMAFGKCELLKDNHDITIANTSEAHIQPNILNKHSADIKNSEHSKNFSSDMEEFGNVMFDYVKNVLGREKINIMPGVYIEKIGANNSDVKLEQKSFDKNVIWAVKDFAETHNLRVDLARATSETGRLFFFKGKSRTLQLKVLK
jgi:hypothetical protein